MNKLRTIVALGVLASLCGCFGSGDSDSKGQKREQHLRHQEMKCFKENGCLLACGSEGKFHQINGRINGYLKTTNSQTGQKPQLGDAIALLSADDSKCYACGAPCMQSGTGVNPSPNPSPTSTACTAGTGTLTIAIGADANGPATSACRATYNASLGSVSPVVAVPAPTGSPVPSVTQDYQYVCACP